MDIEKLLKTAEKAALAAGAVMREHFGKPHEITSKGFRDLVTEADLKAQLVITKIIRGSFPNHGFLTEEKDSTLPAEGPVIWIIDPIDGTTNFSRDFPVFCTSIAAVENRMPISNENVLVGVIYDPMRDELFSAARGWKNELNGESMRISEVNKIEEALVGHDWNRESDLRKKTLNIVVKLSQNAESIRTFGSAALALAWVAAGRIDGYFNYSLNAWDMAAASLMIIQAGGRMTSILGEKPDFSTNRQIDCLASNNNIYLSLLSMVPEKIAQ